MFAAIAVDGSNLEVTLETRINSNIVFFNPAFAGFLFMENYYGDSQSLVS